MARYTVLATDLPIGDKQLLRDILATADADLVIARSAATLGEQAAKADAIMTCFAQVPRSVLTAATRCQTVARFGVGVDNIDVTAATELGMVVSNVPDYCADEVADHVLLLMLVLARRLPESLSGVNTSTTPMRLAGKTLGIVGLGSIGQRLVPRAHALGMTVMAAARPHRPAVPDVTYVPSLDDLLQHSDVVTLHAPLEDSTRGLIGTQQLALMKPTALLINTARGPLIDTAALEHAVRTGGIAGAGLDVTDPEPLPADSPLRTAINVIITPHVAYVSDGSLRELITRAAENVVAVLRGGAPEHVINPAVLKEQASAVGGER